MARTRRKEQRGETNAPVRMAMVDRPARSQESLEIDVKFFRGLIQVEAFLLRTAVERLRREHSEKAAEIVEESMRAFEEFLDRLER